MVVVAGPAGSGKTTLGKALARRIGAAALDLDVLTNPLLDGLGDLLSGGHWLSGPDSARVRAARYSVLREVAGDLVRNGMPVVLIAPFTAELQGMGEWDLLRTAVAPHDPAVIYLNGPAELLAERRAARGESRDAYRTDVPPREPRVPHTSIDVVLSPRQQELRAAQALGAVIPPDAAEPVFARTYEAVLFDLDGTLVDSTPAVLRSWARLGEEFGVPAEAVQRNHGRPPEGLLAEFLAPAEVDRAVALVETFETEDVEGVTALPGALDLLAQLPAHRYAIVTSGTRPVAGARIARAGIVQPAVFVTRDRVTKPKPDPQPFLMAAHELGVDPRRCLVFEDAPAGVHSAVAAGCTVIAMVGTVGADELGQADLVIESLEHLRAVVCESGVQLIPR